MRNRPQSSRERRREKEIKDAACSAAAIALGLLIFFPVAYGVTAAFKTRAELAAYPPRFLPNSFLNFSNFREAFTTAPLLRFMLNSLITAGLGAALRIIFAALAAYAFAVFSFPLKKPLFLLALCTMMLPADTLVVTNYLTVSRWGLLDTYLGVCATSLTGASQMFMLRQAFKTLPASLRESAFIDGAGDFRCLVWIVLPLTSPVIFILLVQSFVTQWNAYLWPLLVTNRTAMRTAQVGIAMLTNPLETNYTLVLAGVAVLLLPSALLFALLRLAIVRGLSSGALVA